jgi:hypothetical protein
VTDPTFPPRRPLAPRDATAVDPMAMLLRMQEEERRRANPETLAQRAKRYGPQALELAADIITPGPVGAGTALHSLYDFSQGNTAEGATRLGTEAGLGLATMGVATKVNKARKLKKLVEALAEGGEEVAQAAVKAPKVAAANLTDESIATLFDGKNAAEADVLARASAHLKQNPNTGQYIGAPRGVDSPGKLGAMRRKVDQKVEDGQFNATWYDRARNTAEDVSGFRQGMDPMSEEGRMASLFARGGAAYSPQASPANEINSFLRQHNAKVLTGQDVRARMDDQMANVARAYEIDPFTGQATFRPERIELGNKTGPYADAKDPTIPEDELYKTANDLWHGRVFGYKGDATNPDVLFDRGFTPQEHGFLTGENLLMADRATAKGLVPPGAAADYKWTPRSGQAATWGAVRLEKMVKEQNAALAKYEKDLAKYEKAKAGGKKASKPSKPQVKSIEQMKKEAAGGIDDAANANTAAITAEFAPGSTSGMFQGFGNVPADVQEQFARQSLEQRGQYNPVVRSMSMFQRPIRTVQGEWVDNATGAVERNLTDVSRPLVDKRPSVLGTTKKGDPKTGGMQMSEQSRGALEFASAIEGVTRGQQGVGMGAFTPANSSFSAAEKTGARITGSAESLAKAKEALSSAGLDVMDYGDGGLLVGRYAPGSASGASWNDAVDGKEIQDKIKKAIVKLDGDFEITPGRLESGLMTVPWGAEGSGQVARFLDEQLSRPDIGWAAPRLDAAGVPELIARQQNVGQELLGSYGVGNRADVQKLMDLLSGSGGGFQNFQRYVRENGFQGLPILALMAGAAAARQQQGQQPGPRRQPGA